MMLDLVRTIIASLTIAVAGLVPAAAAPLQKPTSAEILAAAAQRGKDLLAALREYSY